MEPSLSVYRLQVVSTNVGGIPEVLPAHLIHLARPNVASKENGFFIQQLANMNNLHSDVVVFLSHSSQTINISVCLLFTAAPKNSIKGHDQMSLHLHLTIHIILSRSGPFTMLSSFLKYSITLSFHYIRGCGLTSTTCILF